MLRRSGFIGIGIGLSGLVALSGCQFFDTTTDCRSLSSLVNPGLRTIDAERKGHPESVALHRAIAARYEGLSRSVGRLEFRTRKVGDVALEYQKVLREAASDARAFSEALATHNADRIAAAHANTAKTLKHEAAVVSRLDSICRGK